MYELSIYDAARRLSCSVYRMRMLRSTEILSSFCVDELDVYDEKAALIHDDDFNEWLFSHFMLQSA